MRRKYTDPAKFGRDFEKWAKSFPGRVMERAWSDIGMRVLREAKKRAPVGVHRRGHRAGALRQSLASEVRNGMLLVGSDVEYAKYVEFGTRRIQVGTPQSPRRTWPAKAASGTSSIETMPFLRRSIWALKRRIARTLKKALR